MAERMSEEESHPDNTSNHDPRPRADKKSQLSKGSKSNKPPARIITSPLGVYTLFTEVTAWGSVLPRHGLCLECAAPCSEERTFVTFNSYDIGGGIRGFVNDWPYIWRFILECVSLGPSLILQWAIMSLVSGLLPALSLYFSANLLGLVSSLRFSSIHKSFICFADSNWF